MADNGQTNPGTRPMGFWDIESLVNIFMFAFWFPDSAMFPDSNGDPADALVFFYLFDDMELSPELKARILDRIFERNTALDRGRTQVRFMDMAEYATNRMLLRWFCVDDSRFFDGPDGNRFKYVNPKVYSDLDGDTRFPYMTGYNTANYDCVMMSSYFNEVWNSNPRNEKDFWPVTAKAMRRFNNLLFDRYRDDMKAALNGAEKNIYDNMLRSGLYIDAAKVNDKVYKMPLKRIMGMMGMDIFEDGSVSNDKPVTDPDEIADLFAYNASDCVKLGILFGHRAFNAQFQLKKGLMDSYPDIIYKTENGKKSTRVNRMKADDTSARFAQRVLCPDGWLPDIRALSFEYPKGSGRNVLAETRAWAESKFGKDSVVMRDHLGPIFDWYAALEGKNFDDSEHYDQTHPLDGLPFTRLSSIPAPRTAVPYFNADGSFSRTYVNFGIGGIHGAEYDKDKYEADLAEYDARAAEIKAFLSHFTEQELKSLKPTVVIDGVKYKRSNFITVRKDGSVSPKWPKPVELFVQDKKSGKWNLNKKYSYTSDDEVDHQDFTSYYPCLLMNLQAYVNAALGEDRYVQQFNNKGAYGKIMKDKSRPETERDFYSVLREGTKLILNSASGASDTAYDNPIRMNNVIKSMRLIG